MKIAVAATASGGGGGGACAKVGTASSAAAVTPTPAAVSFAGADPKKVNFVPVPFFSHSDVLKAGGVVVNYSPLDAERVLVTPSPFNTFAWRVVAL